MTSDSQGYGITTQAAGGSMATEKADEIRLVGYTVIPSGLGQDELDDLSRRLDRAMARQVTEFGGADRLASIGDALTVRAPLVDDEAFVEVAANTHVLALVRELLGRYVVLMQQNGVINPPRQPHTQVAYHRDLPYQHFVSSRPLAMSALLCVDPFRLDNGATTVIPASHKVEAFPSNQVAARLDTAVTAEAGSFIVFDSMLFHRAGNNQSDQPRRAVNQVYTVPIIAQQISLPDALGGRYADDPALAELLGYGVRPSTSVLRWRERRFERLSKK